MIGFLENPSQIPNIRSADLAGRIDHFWVDAKMVLDVIGFLETRSHFLKAGENNHL